MDKVKIAAGVFWIEIPEADLRVLCGCPADSVKHLMRRGLINQIIKHDLAYETGPNAVLLSDVSMQNGQFSNMAEFPILQMLYRQGMLIPNHPNNRGVKPLLIGLRNQIQAQSQYIFRGNYGLKNKEEILATGTDPVTADLMMELKRQFAFQVIRSSEELIDFIEVASEEVEIKNKVFIRRLGVNEYEFSYNGQQVTVDLNLAWHEEYEPPIAIDYHRINREYFSVIHVGDGDAWDVNRPCMASIIVFQGKIYLIDTGPNIKNNLTALGISINEVEGIFQTHAHDDHFAGLTTLLRCDQKIKYYATPLVRASVTKKLSALMSISEKRFNNSIEIHDLTFDSWNNIGGLEVRPVFSPHPVETSIFFFRTFWEGGYKTYAHFADIASFEVLENFLIKGKTRNSLHHRFYENFRTTLLEKVDLKKIDVGGGLIHGSAEDFKYDQSLKIILSHTSQPLTYTQKEIGSSATFGMQDVLIPAQQNYFMKLAAGFLNQYFPKAKRYDINMLLNCRDMFFNAGEIILKKDTSTVFVYLVLNGEVEFIDSATELNNKLAAGSFIGELLALSKTESKITYRARSYVRALQIPVKIYTEFIRRNYDIEEIKRIYKNQLFFQNSWLFGETVSSIFLHRIARTVKVLKVAKDEIINLGKESELFMLIKGAIQLLLDDRVVDTLDTGGFCGEESVFLKQASIFQAKATKPSSVFVIPGAVIRDIPVVEWKLLEVYEKRLTAFGTLFGSV